MRECLKGRRSVLVVALPGFGRIASTGACLASSARRLPPIDGTVGEVRQRVDETASRVPYLRACCQ